MTSAALDGGQEVRKEKNNRNNMLTWACCTYLWVIMDILLMRIWKQKAKEMSLVVSWVTLHSDVLMLPYMNMYWKCWTWEEPLALTLKPHICLFPLMLKFNYSRLSPHRKQWVELKRWHLLASCLYRVCFRCLIWDRTVSSFQSSEEPVDSEEWVASKVCNQASVYGQISLLKYCLYFLTTLLNTTLNMKNTALFVKHSCVMYCSSLPVTL